ncbi:hypothetical protein METP3_01597 [Methanosarcinales archaeon]|nr:hypothetical protein METP3_01597 [Methanosarcinales archaeon]
MKHKRKILLGTVIAVLALSMVSGTAFGKNPEPGYPHDTIMIHIQPLTGNTNNCDGGHSLHIGANIEQGRVVSIPETNISLTMQDWQQIDNDGDGLFDEDPVDGIDNDADLLIDEDDKEPGAETRATDCDSRDGDGKVSLQIRDTDPRKGYVSTQEWYMRLVGKPQQNFAFASYANQTINCTSVDPGIDGIPGTADDTYQCDSETVYLGNVDLSNYDGTSYVKAVGSKKGKTNFADITRYFQVDVDIENDGVIDYYNRSIFSVSCEDNPLTTINETLDVCTLGSTIWNIDSATERPTIQLFVSHTGSAQITGARKIRK